VKLARRAAAAALAAAALAMGQTPAARPRLVVDTGSFNADYLTYSAHKHLLAVGGSATANLYAAGTGDELRSFAVADVRGMSFSGDATRLAIADGARDTDIFDVASGALLATLPAGAPIALNRDGSRLAGCGQRGPAATGAPTDAIGPCIELDVWTANGGAKRLLAQAAPGQSFARVLFSPGGSLLAADTRNAAAASAKPDWRTTFWRAGDWTRLSAAPGELMDVSATGASALLALVAGDQHVAGNAADSSWAAQPLRATQGEAAMATGSRLIRWDPERRRAQATLPLPMTEVFAAAFDTRGRIHAVGCGAKGAHLALDTWNAQGVAAPPLQRDDCLDSTAAFAPSGSRMALASFAGDVVAWNTRNGRNVLAYGLPLPQVSSLAFTADSSKLYIGTWRGTIETWNLRDDAVREIQPSKGGVNPILLAMSPDGRHYAAGGMLGDLSYRSLDGTAAPRVLLARPDGESSRYWNLAFSADGGFLAAGLAPYPLHKPAAYHGMLRLFPLGPKPAPPLRFPGYDSASFAREGSHAVLSGEHADVMLWDTATRAGARLPRQGWAGISPDGQQVALYNARTAQAEIWSYRRRVVTAHWPLAGAGADCAVRWLSRGRVFATCRRGGVTTRTVRAAATGKVRFAVSGNVKVVGFSPDGRLLATLDWDFRIHLTDLDSGRETATLVDFGAAIRQPNTGMDPYAAKRTSAVSDWAVVAPNGLFDASDAAMQRLHWVVGLESIALAQLKDRYFEPGLLPKLLGFNHEPLRDVSALRTIALPPRARIEMAPNAPGKLEVTLTNRGGGIGRVQVFVNGKEFRADARGPGADPAAARATLAVDVSGALNPGQRNDVRVVTWNRDGYISSRSIGVPIAAPGRANTAPPALYAIVAGVSRYAGAGVGNLSFSAKDAVDMANALTLGADRLFGARSVHLTLLATAGDPRALPPTKANFVRAFAAARAARPQDVLVVYLAGHGMALRANQDEYLYLTADARSGRLSDYEDPQLRAQWTVSSDELAAWTRAIKAQKQVLVLDTCDAGAAAARLAERRDVPANQVRALERLKDRTGLFVLMGSAADAASYEASQYGQGLLTYALLSGMKGAALRDDEFLDVSRWFDYAVEEVPQLARNIGGIQRPVIAQPLGSSFDIAELTPRDQARIPLATVKPMILRPMLLDAEVEDDVLDLSLAVRRALAALNFQTRGADPAAADTVFVDADDLAGALRPIGMYTVQGNTVRVTLTLRRGHAAAGRVQVDGDRRDVPGLARRVAQAIDDAAAKAEPGNGHEGG
jgi:WD40 repeat protein